MRLLFRVDSGRIIGYGHIRRALVLASLVSRDRGTQCLFLSRDHPERFVHEFPTYILPRNDQHIVTSDPNSWLGDNYQNEIKLLIEQVIQPDDYLYVDHYGVNREWEIAIHPHVKKIVILDDSGFSKSLSDASAPEGFSKQHQCDVLINQTEPIKPLMYTGLYLGGLDYAIINPILSQYRIVKSVCVDVQRVFRKPILTIALGTCLDHSIVHRLIACLDNGTMMINLIGNYPEIHRFSSNLDNIRQYQSLSPDQLGEIYQESDLAIGAGGVMTLEMIYIGLPVIVVSVASNQLVQCQYLREKGLIQYLDHQHDWSETKLQKMVNHYLGHDQVEHRQKCQVAVDGCGAQRIVSKLYP